MKISWMGLGIVLLGVAGCTFNEQIRTSYASPSPFVDPQAVIESTPDYKLGFVEFDDQGWFWQLEQARAVQAMIRQEAGLPVEVPTTMPTTVPACEKLSQGIIIVTFVHGWKDNAEYNNDGVTAFRKMLTSISQGERADAITQHHRSPRKVVGVYAGWRGLTVTWDPLEELTIWDRGKTANRVGGNGSLTRLFTELESIQKDSLLSLKDNAPPTELIIIGHSLGAAATYSALSNIIADRFQKSVALPGYEQKRLKPLGDQIILINPAFEATRHFDLNQMATAIAKYPEGQRPVLSIFTSRGDWATHYVFPIARFFPTLFDSYRDDFSQHKADEETVGWYNPFTTHRLVFNKDVDYAKPEKSGKAPAPVKPPADASMDELVEDSKKVAVQKGRWSAPHVDPNKYYFKQVILEPLDNYRVGNPFLIVSVDRQIIADHSDISNDLWMTFLRNYIDFCRIDPPTPAK